MCTAIRAKCFAGFLNRQINAGVCVPELLIWLRTGKRQIGVAYHDPCLRIGIFQVFFLSIGAMSQGFISTKKESVFYPNISSHNACAISNREAFSSSALSSTSAACRRAWLICAYALSSVLTALVSIQPQSCKAFSW